ncbi:hypothetical protein [Actinophytocola sp.]|uniref:hypothetical protein n=1 Tax=Actinophytocola sp. TaxID=1872138 RepID=UPI002ED4D282
MSHEGGPEQSQRTVAELLAKYGAEGGERPRRRRRRADDPSDTGAQQIIERVLSESGEMQAIRDDTPPPERTSHRRSGERTGFQQPVPPSRRQPGQQSSQQLPRPLPPQPSQQLPRPQPSPGQQSSSRLPMPGIGQHGPTTPVRGTPRPQPPQPSQQLPRPQPSQRMPLPPVPPGGTRERTGIRSRLDGDAPPPPAPPVAGPSAETTEELPRVSGRVPVDGSSTGRRPGMDSRTQISPVYPGDPYADPSVEEDDYRSPYPAADPDDRYDSAEYDNLLDEDERGLPRDAPDELEDLEDDDLDEDRRRSPVMEWLVMFGQLALGVIGGAAVWLGFNWLWGFLPAAALAAAVVVIATLVLIIRKIRRAEDLQTTVLAVLVGLVVTVSPAALLLLNR